MEKMQYKWDRDNAILKKEKAKSEAKVSN